MALADMDGNETFEASNLGTAEEVGSIFSDLAAFGLCPACHSVPASRLQLSFWGRMLGSSCTSVLLQAVQLPRCTLQHRAGRNTTCMHHVVQHATARRTSPCWPQHNVYVPMQVEEETVADDDVLMIKGCKNSRAVTVLLRGANEYLLDEMDRSLHDAFCIVKRVVESGAVVPGARHASALLSSTPHSCLRFL
jgi:TCP-1/cpn60 chaperonin family